MLIKIFSFEKKLRHVKNHKSIGHMHEEIIETIMRKPNIGLTRQKL